LIAGDMSKKPMWYEKYGIQSLPHCELINNYGFYIPNHQDLTENEINLIINIINE
jgi:dTDP-4-amino-4,6-dideoxygalactose transaminase